MFFVFWNNTKWEAMFWMFFFHLENGNCVIFSLGFFMGVNSHRSYQTEFKVDILACWFPEQVGAFWPTQNLPPQKLRFGCTTLV